MPKDLNAMNVGTQKSANVNNPNPRPLGARSSFPDLAYRHFSTYQYGLVGVFDHFHTVRHDQLQFRNQHDIHSYTLSSPMLSGVTMNKTWVRVPYKAIYPKNWDIMLPLATKGDDVPDDVRCVLGSNFWTFLTNTFDTFVSFGQDISEFNPDMFKNLIGFVFLLESIYSSGAIPAKLNLNFHALFSARKDDVLLDFDDFFDLYFAPWLASTSGILKFQFQDFGGLIFQVGSSGSFVPMDGFGYQSQNWAVPLSYLISLMRHYDFTVINVSDGGAVSNPFYSWDSDVTDFDSRLFDVGSVNIESVVAYQLACYQFFTNEHVDYIYSADLFRRAILSSFFINVEEYTPTFPWNGELLQYDVFSRGFFDYFIGGFNLQDININNITAFIDIFRNIFGINQSLRYGDYFTGARPRPLAVGDYSVEVVDGSVDTLESVRGMQLVRLANNANLAGSKVGNYLQALWGGNLPEAPDDIPSFLVHQSFAVKGFEVENTGDAQVSSDNQIAVTTQLRTQDNKHAFEYFEDRDYSIIIGLVSFDCERLYSNTTDRFAFHFDRYDDFLPQLQYVGDQEIYAKEIDIRNNHLAPVAYTVRNMEYKQAYSRVSGGFVKRLPSWAFVADNETGIPLFGNISPSYIRSIPAEFDRFYKSLTGYSLGTRFHFIVRFSNVNHATRQMEYQPQILK